jgi:flagellar biosynthesis/type III secretory pathway protein FliH
MNRPTAETECYALTPEEARREREAGEQEGLQKGRQKGRQEGIAEGMAKGRQEILAMLPETQREKIMQRLGKDYNVDRVSET